MKTTLSQVLEERANQVSSTHVDVDELVGLGERRLRRRQVTAILAGAVAVVLVIAFAFGSATLHGSGKNTQGPVDQPVDTHHATPIRKIVYSDDIRSSRSALFKVGSLQVGDREVEIDQRLNFVREWSMVVTDAGAVYTQDDHTVWFTDGSRPRQIATQACHDSAGDFAGLVTGNAGPLVAWFDCSPSSQGDLVVYDTDLGYQVARHSIPSCKGTGACMADGLIGEYVYFGHFDRNGWFMEHQSRLDVSSDEVSPAGPRMFAEDLLNHSRALVVGDSWRTGTPSEEADFRAVGPRLVPVNRDEPQSPTRAFDTATGHSVRLRVPTGYAADDTDVFSVLEWLDDDTVALGQHDGQSIGDILACHLSNGRCTLAVEQAPHDKRRIVAGGSIPG